MKRNERGVALIAAVMVVAILAGIGISFAFNMRLEEKASANYLWKTQADAIAYGGIERAILELIERRDEQYTFLGNDGYELFTPPDVSLGLNLIARTRIAIYDEAGKVNINTSGHTHPPAPTNLSPFGFSLQGRSLGWTTAEIGLPPQLVEQEPGDPGLSVEELRNKKFGADGQPGAAGDDPHPIWDPRFWHNLELAGDGIDNDGDGLVDAPDDPDEGIDEPSEFVFLEGGRISLDFTHDDRPFITVGETEVPGAELSRYTTLYSRDRDLYQDQWWQDTGGVGGAKIDLNTASLTVIRDELVALGIPNPEQIALNIRDFRDADNAPSWGWGRIGIERTLFINEIQMHNEGLYWWYDYELDRVELHNPWDVEVSGRYMVTWTNAEGLTQTHLNSYVEIPDRGFWYYYRDIHCSELPGGTIRLWYCPAGDGTEWRMVERIVVPTYHPVEFTYHAKNDPRVPEFTYSGRDESLGKRNCSVNQGFDPTVGGEVPIEIEWAGHFNHFDRHFANPGELGYIHTGGQWETLLMRGTFILNDANDDGDYDDPGENLLLPGIDTNGDGIIDRPHQGRLLDRFTVNHPYNRMGRININTAERGVLTSLPQMHQGSQAEGIFQRRQTNPFNTIGDAVPYLTAVVGVEASVTPLINELMDWIQDAVNSVIHWPSTWPRPVDGIGDDLHNWMLDELEAALNPISGPNPIVIRNPTDDPPTYVNFFANPLTRSIVEGISLNIANIAQRAIGWARQNVPDWFGWRDRLINASLNPIIRAANTAYEYTIVGDNLDGDSFRGEDDERETIVRSVSNLITTRSDRFEIVSTGSVLRGEEILAESRMRVILCRISVPATILHFERR